MKRQEYLCVRYYIVNVIKRTKCMQKHFVQLCQRCSEYSGCKLYSKYCDGWIKLQKFIQGIRNELKNS